MKRKWFQVVALTLSVTLSTTIAQTAEAAFSDVKASNSHKEAIDALATQGIIQGFEDGTYRPNNIVTRGQVAKILVKALDLKTETVENPNFSDVPLGHTYYKEIAALKQAGIIQGFTDGSFQSGRSVTREQLARMLVNGFALSYNDVPLPFSDIVAGSESHYYIGALYESHITIGSTKKSFDLYSPVTRGQLATFVYRVQQVMENRAIERLRAEDFNVTFIDTYTYEIDDPVIMLHQSLDGVVVEALQEGTATLMIDGYRESDEYMEYIFTQKYEVTVKEVDGRLSMTIEEDDSVSPASVLFDVSDVGFAPTDIAVQTLAGEPLRADAYDLRYYEDSKMYELIMYDIGQYIVTFKNDAGLTQRAGLVSEFGEMELVVFSAYERSEAAIPFTEIGFTPTKVAYEQFTGAMFGENVVTWDIAERSFNIFHAMVGDAMFAFKLYGANGEVAFVQGASYQTAGVTTIEYVIVSEEEMESGIF